ncbi:TM2 domain-containing protein [Roseimicrobium sp. ORNL1]|uniref:TM2 domain-containing protein n=1 Tax=Roseimicrobium sp. ORNL1 TaxID=2711231 RepID=UPI0013E0EE6B|nr:TM2 domain-containing protein [Roseimicrobium sp. ORNL1]QIF00703.1 TM2 domain-containing protein [Roseimicrobium sp. ORNL1]
MSDKKFLPALLLAIFLGFAGGHRFYVGKTGTAILQLVTCGGAGVWVLIDIVMIAMGKFLDKNNLPLAK